MSDTHWGYGFPIDDVAAFYPDQSDVASAAGLGFDILCGVRTLPAGLRCLGIEPVKKALAGNLFNNMPAELGSTRKITHDNAKMDEMRRAAHGEP